MVDRGPSGWHRAAGSGYGSYNDYSSTFAAENGTYTLNMTDSWGDGWNGGYLTLSYENGGSVGTFELGYGTSGTESFTVSCP